MRIIKAYEYLFYKLYQRSTKLNGVESSNLFLTTINISADLTLNIYAITLIMSGVFNYYPEYERSKVTWFIIGTSVVILNYLTFKHKNRYLKILDRYKNEGDTSARQGSIIVGVYQIGSFVIVGIIMFLSIYLRSN